MRSAYDLKIGYAATVHKAEGPSIDSAVIIFEKWAPEGWAYTALSRMRRKSDLRIIGEPCATKFRPRL